MKHIVLYDMDGTLTPPREPLEESMVPVLEQLSEVAKIGIVTGSDPAILEEYKKQGKQSRRGLKLSKTTGWLIVESFQTKKEVTSSSLQRN